MSLSIENLMHDYETTKGVSSLLTKRLEVLIECSKIEEKQFEKADSISVVTQKKKLKQELFASSGFARRTVSRWKKNYNERGLEGLKPKREK